jgi:CheY-like chemotaxis protein
MSKKILVVEDNEMNRDMLTRRLERKGFITEIAINGEDAINIIDKYNPDIILMDMSLPIMDGWEATKYLKNNNSTQSIPIIGLSAHARDVDIRKGIESGCDAYETKPIDLTRLLSTINLLLSQ